MAYIECRNAVIANLQTLTTHFPTTAQVVANDETILDKGTLAAAILLPGLVGLERGKANYIRTWGIILDLYYSWRGDLLTTLTAFDILRDAVIAKMDSNSQLIIAPATSGVTGVLDVLTVSDGDPGEFARNKSVIFVAQRFRVTVLQHLRAPQ